MDIGGWLRSFGLEQYEATFRENAINEKVLRKLRAEDLKDIGVGMLAIVACYSMPSLKIAKAMGLTVPEALSVRGDKVIEQ
jgi:hypothetical protein